MAAVLCFVNLLLIVSSGLYIGVAGNKLNIVKALNTYMDGPVRKDRLFYSETSSLIRHAPARSLIECMNMCMSHMEDKPCVASVYLAHQRSGFYGRCMLLDQTYVSQKPTDEVGELMYGQFTSFKLLESEGLTNSNSLLCDSIDCAEGTTCYILSSTDDSDAYYPYCITDNSDCDLEEEYTNIQHFYGHHYSDETDDGIFQMASYVKTRSDTLIRVNYNANLMGHYQHANECKRFYVTFNGAECSDPGRIEWVTYSEQTGDMRRAASIDGTCYNIAAGTISVELRLGTCEGYGANDGLTGYIDNRQLLVMEIVPRDGDASAPCPGLSVFNYKYTSIWQSSYSHGYGNTVFTADTYRKAAEDTNLRIKFQATLSSEMDSDVARCSRWAVMVDGSECSHKADAVVYLTTTGCFSYHKYYQLGSTIEAICEGISAGAHSVTVVTTQCPYTQTEPALYHTGWKANMRMHIEEVRQSPRLDAVLTLDRRVLRSPFSNVIRQHYWLMDSDIDGGELNSFTYTKNNDYTALRLTASGDHRTYHYNSTTEGKCSRWYFKIDDVECSDPGPIEGVYYFNYPTIFHHPMQVTGVCYGVGSGEVKVAYWVGTCEGFSMNGDAFTGWGSSFHLIAEEINLEETKTCTSASPMVCN